MKTESSISQPNTDLEKTLYSKLIKIAPHMTLMEKTTYVQFPIQRIRVEIQIVERESQKMKICLSQLRETQIGDTKGILVNMAVDFESERARTMSYLKFNFIGGLVDQNSFSAVGKSVDRDSLVNRLLDRLLMRGCVMSEYT